MTPPVTVVVARSVADGREEEFRRWAQQLTDAAERFPGFLGWGLLRRPRQPPVYGLDLPNPWCGLPTGWASPAPTGA